MGPTGVILLAVLFIFLLILLSQAVIVVQQSNRYVVERLGVYSKSLDAGSSSA